MDATRMKLLPWGWQVLEAAQTSFKATAEMERRRSSYSIALEGGSRTIWLFYVIFVVNVNKLKTFCQRKEEAVFMPSEVSHHCDAALSSLHETMQLPWLLHVCQSARGISGFRPNCKGWRWMHCRQNNRSDARLDEFQEQSSLYSKWVQSSLEWMRVIKSVRILAHSYIHVPPKTQRNYAYSLPLFPLKPLKPEWPQLAT